MNEKLLAQFRSNLEALYYEFIQTLVRRENSPPNVELERAVMKVADCIQAVDCLLDELMKGDKMGFFSRKKEAGKEPDPTKALVERLKEVHTGISEIIRHIDQVDWYNRRDAAMAVKAQLEKLVGTKHDNRGDTASSSL